MATSSPSIDSLSKDERVMIVDALKLKHASVLRAFRAESNADIAEIRRLESIKIDSLILRFR